MTQRELAAQLNIAPSTLGSYVQNAREPDFATLKLLAGFFHVSLDYLLDYSQEPGADVREREMLRIFRSLAPEQQEICVEQCRVFARFNHRSQKAGW